MTISSPDDPQPSAWSSLGPVEQAREWEDFRPGTFEQVFELARHEADYRRTVTEAESRHERRLDYIAIAIQVLTLTFALSAVVIMALTAKYYADHGAASEGVKIFGFGSASIVAAFLGVNAAPITRRFRSLKNRGSTSDGSHAASRNSTGRLSFDIGTVFGNSKTAQIDDHGSPVIVAKAPPCSYRPLMLTKFF